jgi:hypothetical protein
VSQSFGYIPKSGIAGSNGRSMFSFWSSLQIVFQSGCTSLHSQQQYKRVPFFPACGDSLNCVFIWFVELSISNISRIFRVSVFFLILHSYWWFSCLGLELTSLIHSSISLNTFWGHWLFLKVNFQILFWGKNNFIERFVWV